MRMGKKIGRMAMSKERLLDGCIFRSLNTAFPSKIGQVNGEIRPCLRLRRPSAFFNKFLL